MKKVFLDTKFKRERFEQQRRSVEADRKKLEEKLARLQAATRDRSKKIAYNMKYLYVKGGHTKNEILGFLTIFNANRAGGLNIKRMINYDSGDRRLYLNIYQRKDRDRTKKAPVFVYIHGGGWIGGAPETREAFNTRVAEAGYFVVSIFYGHAPFYAHPEHIQNVYKAFAWIKKHAEEYNVDADEIFVGGESAGAHLSAMAGAISTNPEYNSRFELDETSRHQRIRGLALNCGVYDLNKAVTIPFKNIKLYVQSYCGGTPLEDMPADIQKEMSPINWVTSDFPPTYAISAENDKLAVLTFDLIGKLDDLGVDLSHYHAKGKFAVHAFAVAQIMKISKEAMFGLRAFLHERSAEFMLPPPNEKRKGGQPAEESA